MLSVGQLQEGVVLDHIPAGKAMDIYKRLKLDRLDCQVAMIMHAHSNKMGQKDIIKVEAHLASSTTRSPSTSSETAVSSKSRS